MARLDEIPKLISYQIGREPLWGSDAGRESMAGQYSGTFIGYFTKITLNIGRTTQEELSIIKGYLEVPLFNFTYPDDKTSQDRTEKFYGTAIKPQRNNLDGKYEGFTIDLTAISRR